MTQHKSMQELKAGLPEILAAPKDNGEIKAVTRESLGAAAKKSG